MKPGIEPVTPGLQGKRFIHYTTMAPLWCLVFVWLWIDSSLFNTTDYLMKYLTESSAYHIFVRKKITFLINYHRIFTFPLWVFKWTFTFEMWFIPSRTNRLKPHSHTCHLSGLMSSPSNNVACLLTFAWHWTRIAMTLSAEIWHFGYSKPYVMSDLIQNIWKTSQVRWKLKIDTGLIHGIYKM